MAPPPALFLKIFGKLYVGRLYVHFICEIFIRWEAFYVLTLYVLTLYVGKHYMLGSFIRSDVIRSDVIRSDIIRSDVIRSVIICSVGESINLTRWVPLFAGFKMSFVDVTIPGWSPAMDNVKKTSGHKLKTEHPMRWNYMIALQK